MGPLRTIFAKKSGELVGKDMYIYFWTLYAGAVIGLHQYHFAMVTEASRKPRASRSSSLVFFEICSAHLTPFAFSVKL